MRRRCYAHFHIVTIMLPLIIAMIRYALLIFFFRQIFRRFHYLITPIAYFRRYDVAIRSPSHALRAEMLIDFLRRHAADAASAPHYHGAVTRTARTLVYMLLAAYGAASAALCLRQRHAASTPCRYFDAIDTLYISF